MTPERAEEIYRSLPDSDREAICVSAIRLVECWDREAVAHSSVVPDEVQAAIEDEGLDLINQFQEIVSSAVGPAAGARPAAEGEDCAPSGGATSAGRTQ